MGDCDFQAEFYRLFLRHRVESLPTGYSGPSLSEGLSILPFSPNGGLGKQEKHYLHPRGYRRLKASLTLWTAASDSPHLRADELLEGTDVMNAVGRRERGARAVARDKAKATYLIKPLGYVGQGHFVS